MFSHMILNGYLLFLSFFKFLCIHFFSLYIFFIYSSFIIMISSHAMRSTLQFIIIFIYLILIKIIYNIYNCMHVRKDGSN